MDRSTGSRPMNTNDPDFSDRIRRLLGYNSDAGSSDSYEEADDSDADPDWDMSGDNSGPLRRFLRRPPRQEDFEESEDDDDVILKPNPPNDDNVLQSQDSSSDDSEDDDDLLNQEVAIANPPQGNLQVDLPEFFIERRKKTEAGPPNAWRSKPPPVQVRTPARNIIRTGLPGVRGAARALGDKPTKKQIWDLLFDDTMLNIIVENTNKKLSVQRERLGENTNKYSYKDTNKSEINALLGLLVLSSIMKSNDEPIISLFSKDSCGRAIFPATMQEKRYLVLTAALRFDDAETRAERRLNDKSAPIAELFTRFIANCQRGYCVSSEVTVDEMLVPFRGRCPFRVYMPKKPKKYGIKVLCLADAKTSYLLNAYIYSGKDSDSVGLTEEEKKLSIPTQSVLRLSRPIQGSNRNITADNWFSSIELIDELAKRKLTFVGTLRKDKKCIPEEFLQNPKRPVGSSLYGFRPEEKTTILSYVPQKNRAVMLVSSMHHTVKDNEVKRKPEIISNYNSTKCGVDLLDMKCAIFSSNRRTRRWPMAIFYRLLNIGTVNSYIMFLCFKNSPDMTRFQFIKELGYELITPHLQARLTSYSLPRELRVTIEKVVEESNKLLQPYNQQQRDQQPPAPRAQADAPGDKMEKRRTCSTCPSAKKRKTAYKCIDCQKPICLECSRKVCVQCASNRGGK